MYEYQITKRYFAQIAESIKDLGIQELHDLGASNITPEYGGLYFNAGKEALYRINYSSRLVSRVLAPLVSFNCRAPEQLYKKARGIKWMDFISVR